VSLEDWLGKKLIENHRPSAGEIASLLHICDRDLGKVKIIELGPDWRLSIAHNAALQAATAALAAAGYRARLPRPERGATLPCYTIISLHHQNRSRYYQATGQISREAQHQRL
jgi:hypothetical protein